MAADGLLHVLLHRALPVEFPATPSSTCSSPSSSSRPPRLRARWTTGDGVDIEAGGEWSAGSEPGAGDLHAGVLSEIGSFGGLFTMEPGGRRAGPGGERRRRGDEAQGGVHGRAHDTVGEDLVNHCVNDILVQGASPLFFLDYLATGRLARTSPCRSSRASRARARERVRAARGRDGGDARVLRRRRVRPGGLHRGMVDRLTLVDGRAIVPGDVLIGLRSSGSTRTGTRSRDESSSSSCVSTSDRTWPSSGRRWRGAARAAPLLLRGPAAGGDGCHPGMATYRRGSPTTCLAHCRPAPWPTWDRRAWEVPPSSASCRRPEACPTTTAPHVQHGIGLVLVVAQRGCRRVRPAAPRGESVPPSSAAWCPVPSCATSEKGRVTFLTQERV